MKTLTILTIATLTSAKSGAGVDFNSSLHDSSGEGRAKVFDGGPPVFGLDTTSGPDEWSLGFCELGDARE